MLAQVGRPFEAEGIQYETGDIVDVTGWPRVQRMQTLRYLLPAPKNATPSKAKRSSGGATSAPAAPSAPAALEPAPKAARAPRKPAAKKAAPRKPAAKKAAPAK